MRKVDDAVQKAKSVIDKLSSGSMVGTEYMLECLQELVESIEFQRNKIRVLSSPKSDAEYGWRG